jgi:hypothetical protein
MKVSSLIGFSHISFFIRLLLNWKSKTKSKQNQSQIIDGKHYAASLAQATSLHQAACVERRQGATR